MNTRKLPHVVNHLYTNNKVDKIKINLQTKGTVKKKKDSNTAMTKKLICR
jgi:hypothetical protein